MRVNYGKIINGIFLLLGAIIIMLLSSKVIGKDLSQYAIPIGLLSIGLWLALDGGIKSVMAMIDSIRHPTWRSILHVTSLVIGGGAIILSLAILIPMIQKIPVIPMLVKYANWMTFLTGATAIAEGIENLIPK